MNLSSNFYFYEYLGSYWLKYTQYKYYLQNIVDLDPPTPATHHSTPIKVCPNQGNLLWDFHVLPLKTIIIHLKFMETKIN